MSDSISAAGEWLLNALGAAGRSGGVDCLRVSYQTTKGFSNKSVSLIIQKWQISSLWCPPSLHPPQKTSGRCHETLKSRWRFARAAPGGEKKPFIISASLCLSKCLLAFIKQRNLGSCWLRAKEERKMCFYLCAAFFFLFCQLRES